jgi:hypothetical protein
MHKLHNAQQGSYTSATEPNRTERAFYRTGIHAVEVKFDCSAGNTQDVGFSSGAGLHARSLLWLIMKSVGRFSSRVYRNVAIEPVALLCHTTVSRIKT